MSMTWKDYFQLFYSYKYISLNVTCICHININRRKEEQSENKIYEISRYQYLYSIMVKIRLCVENQKNKRAVAKNSGMLSFYPPPSPHMTGATHIIPSCKWSYHEMVHIWRDREIHTEYREKGRENKWRIQGRKPYLGNFQYNLGHTKILKIEVKFVIHI